MKPKLRVCRLPNRPNLLHTPRTWCHSKPFPLRKKHRAGLRALQHTVLVASAPKKWGHGKPPVLQLQFTVDLSFRSKPLRPDVGPPFGRPRLLLVFHRSKGWLVGIRRSSRDPRGGTHNLQGSDDVAKRRKELLELPERHQKPTVYGSLLFV